MAVYNKWVASTQISTDALFREYGKWHSDAFETLGWAKQGDTGQIDWTTVTRETSFAFTMRGYEIRKSGTGGGTAVYMKIQYGSGYSINALGFKVQYGTGSDGAGTLTGSLATEYNLMGASGAVNEVGFFTMAGDDERWTMGQGGVGTPANNSVGFFQRTCDTNGADNGTGFAHGMIGYTTAQLCSNQYAEFSGGAGTKDANYSMMYFPRLSCAGGAVPYFPMFMQGLTNSGYFMLRDIIACPYQFAPIGSIHTISHYGQNLTYKSILGNTTASTHWGYTTPVTMACLMRID
jgi:hypothetical protein